MKKLYLYGGLVLGGLFFLTACNNASYDTLDNAVYISETQKGNLKKIIIDDDGGKATLTVRVAAPLEKDVKVKIGVASEQELVEFNKKNGTSYVALPTENFELSEQDLIIQQGKVTAPTVSITVNPLSDEQIESGNKYVVPLSILSADELILKSSKSIFYAIDQVIVTKVPYLKNNGVTVNLPDEKMQTLQWTLEYRVWAEKLYTTNTAQGLFYWGAGPATEIYLRWGDANVAGNLIMIKNQGAQFVSTKAAKSGQWYHHAWVHDGKTVKLYIDGELDAQMDSPGKTSELSQKFSFNASSFGYMFSEIRFWSVARNATQIKENIWGVNPKLEEGLEVYLKMNEGSGKTFKDLAGKHTVDASAANNIEWRTIRSDNK